VRFVSGMFALVVMGCQTAEPGYYFDVVVTGVENGCDDSSPGYSERFEYRVVPNGTAVSLYIDGALLGSGSREGCDISYESPTWGGEYKGDDVRWVLRGEATAAIGGCGDDAFVGTESAIIREVGGDSLDVGCEYEMSVEGDLVDVVE
jgi:hypothetical protein